VEKQIKTVLCIDDEPIVLMCWAELAVWNFSRGATAANGALASAVYFAGRVQTAY
jgi:hypothetical protein